MRAINFLWSNSIYLHIGRLKLDLHNDYDFKKVIYDIEQRSVLLEWHRGSGEWVSNALPHQIQILMTEIYGFRVLPRDPKMPVSEDNCLNSFGYDCDEDWADGQFWVDSAPEPEWRWSFLFQSGMEIQVDGESASVTVTP